VVTGIFSGSIALAGVAFFVWEIRRLTETRRRPRGFISRAQSIRRLVGAAGVVAVAVMFFWGVNFLPSENPLTFVLFWSSIALGALLLGFLGIMDMRQVRRQFQDTRRKILKAETPELPGKGLSAGRQGVIRNANDEFRVTSN
jgi:hypothetical protein